MGSRVGAHRGAAHDQLHAHRRHGARSAGGVRRSAARETLTRVAALREEIDKLLTANRIFVDRTRGTGIINAEDAVDFGFTGPCLRASGVAYDVRKIHPYLVYDRLEFEVPLGTNGDNFDR